jgi:hypothetical protein
MWVRVRTAEISTLSDRRISVVGRGLANVLCSCSRSPPPAQGPHDNGAVFPLRDLPPSSFRSCVGGAALEKYCTVCTQVRYLVLYAMQGGLIIRFLMQYA